MQSKRLPVRIFQMIPFSSAPVHYSSILQHPRLSLQVSFFLMWSAAVWDASWSFVFPVIYIVLQSPLFSRYERGYHLHADDVKAYVYVVFCSTHSFERTAYFCKVVFVVFRIILCVSMFKLSGHAGPTWCFKTLIISPRTSFQYYSLRGALYTSNPAAIRSDLQFLPKLRMCGSLKYCRSDTVNLSCLSLSTSSLVGDLQEILVVCDLMSFHFSLCFCQCGLFLIWATSLLSLWQIKWEIFAYTRLLMVPKNNFKTNSIMSFSNC